MTPKAPVFLLQVKLRLCTCLPVILPPLQHPQMSNFYFPYSRLCSRIAVPLATAVLILVAFPFNRSLVYSLLVDGRYPPLYLHHHERELELPHYRSYEHSDVKYLWSPNHPASMLTDTLRANLADRHCRSGMGKYNARLHLKPCPRIRDQSLVGSLAS